MCMLCDGFHGDGHYCNHCKVKFDCMNPGLISSVPENHEGEDICYDCYDRLPRLKPNWCWKCRKKFRSTNKLWEHLRETPGHIMEERS